MGRAMVHPTEAFRAALAGHGSLFDVIPWAVVVAITVAPTDAGESILLARLDPRAGVLGFLGLIGNRMAIGFIGVVIAAMIVFLLGQIGGRSPSFDRCLDATGYLLVPHLILAALGAALSASGHELWFMPHRLLRGGPGVFAIRLAVAYGASLVLLVALCFIAARPNEEESMTPEDVGTRDKRSGLVLALLLLGALVLVGGPIWRIATGPLPPGPGKAAPSLAATTPDGKEESLAKHQGEVVILDFWATWCPPCVAAMPALERLHRAYKDRGFSVIGVNQEPEDVPSVRRFIADRGLTLPVVIDGGAIAKEYGVFSFPTSFVIGRDGVIRKIHHGPATEAELISEIEPLLQEGGGSVKSASTAEAK
jgi:thiol-disulfide isomerase/thioredoxin